MSAYCETSLNGTAIYLDLGREVFTASIYLENPARDSAAIINGDGEIRLEVNILDTISKSRWANLWVQGIAINNPRTQFEQQADNFATLFEKIKGSLLPNDVFEITFTPGQGTRITLNSKPFISQPDRDLLTLFLRAWIGPVPPSTQFKEMILGRENYQVAFNKIPKTPPTQARNQIISQWLISNEKALTETKPAVKAKQEKPAAQVENLENTAIEIPLEIKQLIEPPALPEFIAKPEQAIAPMPVAQDDSVNEKNAEITVESILAQREYTTMVIQKIYEKIVYPRRAISRNIQGSIKLNLSIGRSGELISAEIEQSSGFPLLDNAALSAADKVGKFDAIPESITEVPQQLSIPISFRLQ